RISPTTIRTGRERAGSDHSALHVPVCRPAGIVEEIRRWQTGIPAIDTSQLPTAEYAVNNLIAVVQKPSAASHGQLPDGIEVDDMAYIKVGVRVPIVLPDRIQDESVAESCAWQTAGCQT